MPINKKVLGIIIMCIIGLLFFQCGSVPAKSGKRGTMKMKKGKLRVKTAFKSPGGSAGSSPEMKKVFPKKIHERLNRINLNHGQKSRLINGYQSLYIPMVQEDLNRLKKDRKKHEKGSYDYKRITDEINAINQPLSKQFGKILKDTLTKEQYKQYKLK